MSRSIWKINVNDIIDNTRRKRLYITDIGKIIAVHNGKNSTNITIQANMIGSFLGDFVFTKKMGNSIHREKKKKKSKK